jgi:hypothetical protein
MGRVVHDDRGNALVQWQEAPPDFERPVLEVEASGIHRLLHGQEGSLSLDSQRSFDPYASSGPLERKRPNHSAGSTSRTDLRKLSAWIKMMRELEERKQRGEPDED